ncbi:lariat debranching enzyme, C-terminal domain-containing protein [Trametes polyzona]|nr:lariat debranching enzyme, C-terminal domain-containing protein [Trametes polyzona]
MGLLHTLHPQWWFSTHLHCRFEATVVHGPPGGEEAPEAPKAATSAERTNPDEISIDDEDEGPAPPAASGASAASAALPAIASPGAIQIKPEVPRNPDEITLDDEEDEVEAPPPPPPARATTRFLALDKCLPRRKFLEVIDVDAPMPSPSGAPVLAFDPEWLAITRAFHSYMSLSRTQATYPDEESARAAVQESLDWVSSHLLAKAPNGVLKVEDVQQFAMTAPGPAPDEPRAPPPYCPNPQTAALCAMLQIENKVAFSTATPPPR